MKAKFSERWLVGARAILGILFLSMALASCRSLAAGPEPLVSAEVSPFAIPATPTPAVTPTATPTPADLWIDPSGVQIHPDGGLYSGDTLSLRIEAQNGGFGDLAHVPVVVDWGSGRATDEIGFIPHGSSAYTDLLWVWDTGSLVGTQTITVTIDPEDATGDPDLSNNVVIAHIDLAADRPDDEIGAAWETMEVGCCIFHYIRGTAAARDIGAIARLADEAVAYAKERLGTRGHDQLEVYLIDRVLGHGGFASAAIAISYLDRNYAGGGLLEVFRHEGTHLLDRRIGDGERPVFLVEGLAVYVTGGHFRVEPLPERAAALLQIGAYIPLRDLIDDFYPSQHETGYLEAGAFIDYLVRRGGFDAFVDLYGGMRRERGESDSDLLDREMRRRYGVGLDEMEAEWVAYLRSLDAGSQRRDLENTIAFYDTVRRYQRALDPSAYYLSAWLPDIVEARKRGLVADYMRHPRAAENIALETMLVAADQALAVHDYDQVETLLSSINAVFDADLAFDDPTAARYLRVVQATLSAGYEPQRIAFDTHRAEVLATQGGDPALVHLSAGQQGEAWSVWLSR